MPELLGFGPSGAAPNFVKMNLMFTFTFICYEGRAELVSAPSLRPPVENDFHIQEKCNGHSQARKD